MKNPFFLFLWAPFFALAQVYEWNDPNTQTTHRILMDDSYVIETVFKQSDGEFVNTRGGYYTRQKDALVVTFEFNANYAQDSLTQGVLAPEKWVNVSRKAPALEGKFLMAGRVQPEGEQRRDLNRSRKTMKFLQDGFFQWIAFDTKNLRFIATGGGTYSANNGNYVETLGFFSRDKSRVGKVLPFQYTLKNNDWYHRGKSSKGKPLHEIWQRRTQ